MSDNSAGQAGPFGPLEIPSSRPEPPSLPGSSERSYAASPAVVPAPPVADSLSDPVPLEIVLKARPASRSVLADRHRGSGLFRRCAEAIAPRWSARGPAAVIQTVPSWLISLLVHMILLVILGIWLLPEARSRVLSLSATFAESLGDQLEFDTVEIGSDTEEVQPPVVTPVDLPPVDQPLLAPRPRPSRTLVPWQAVNWPRPTWALHFKGVNPG